MNADDQLIRLLTDGPTAPAVRSDATGIVLAGVERARRRRAVTATAGAVVAVAIAVFSVIAGPKLLTGSAVPAAQAPTTGSSVTPTARLLPITGPTAAPLSRTAEPAVVTDSSAGTTDSPTSGPRPAPGGPAVTTVTTTATPTTPPAARSTAANVGAGTGDGGKFASGGSTVAESSKAGSSNRPTQNTTAPAPAVVHLTTFDSPSHNIHCSMSDGSYVHCQIDDFAYTPSPVASPCGSNGTARWGSHIALLSSGRVVLMCGSGGRITSTSVLQYGQTSTVGDASCTSSDTGITCRQTGQDASFSISRSAYALHGLTAGPVDVPDGATGYLAEVSGLGSGRLVFRSAVQVNVPDLAPYFVADPDQADPTSAPVNAATRYLSGGFLGKAAYTGSSFDNHGRGTEPVTANQVSAQLAQRSPVLAQIDSAGDGTVISVAEIFQS